MSPEPLPQPPSDRACLADFPTVPKEKLPDKLWRMHKVDNEPEYFATRPDRNRWDPPLDSIELFGTCYASGDPTGAFIETFGELAVITQGEIDRRALAQIELPPEPRWADMTDPRIVGWGLDERIGVGVDYDTCQRWSDALFAVGFTGIMFRARSLCRIHVPISRDLRESGLPAHAASCPRQHPYSSLSGGRWLVRCSASRCGLPRHCDTALELANEGIVGLSLSIAPSRLHQRCVTFRFGRVPDKPVWLAARFVRDERAGGGGDRLPGARMPRRGCRADPGRGDAHARKHYGRVRVPRGR